MVSFPSRVSSQAPGVDTQQLVHLPLDETSGAVAHDLSGSGRHAAIGADVLLDRSGILGRAGETTAPGGSAGTSADGLSLADFSPTDSYLELSAAIWYQITPGAHGGYLFHWGGTYEAPNAISAFLNVGTGIRVRVHDGGDTSSSLLVVPAGFDDTRWHHLAITKDSGGIAVYFDGLLAGGSTAMGRGAIAPAIGAALGMNENGKYGVTARLDDFRLWPRKLSAADVASLYAAGSNGAIRMSLEPAGARAAGAAWRLTSGPDTAWHASGETTAQLPPGIYQVQLADLADWGRPPSPAPVVVVNSLQSLAASYQSLAPQSPRLHWRLDETAFPLATDASGHQHHGTYGANVLLAQDGIVDGGIRTRGAGTLAHTPADALSVSNLLGGSPLADLSVALWYRLPEGAHDGYLFSWGGSNNSPNHVSAYLDAGTGLRVRVRPAGDTSSVVALAPAGYDDTGWHHLAVVKSGAAVAVYFDGILAKSATAASPLLTTNGLFRVGANEVGAFGVDATFDEVLVYSRALPAAEVGALAASPANGRLTLQLGPPGAALLGPRWRLASGPDTAWHASGETVTVPRGVYPVETEAVAKWVGPAGAFATVRPVDTTTATLIYTPAPVAPIAHLGLEEGGGSVAGDGSGTGRHGLYGARVARGLEGVSGHSAQTAGIGASSGSFADGVRVAGLVSSTAYSEATVSLWYRLPAEAHDGYLFGWGGTNTATNSISVFMDVGAGLKVRVHAAGDASSSILASPAGFDDAAWHHLVVVKEAAGSRTYLDGVQVNSSAMGAGTFKPGLGFFLGMNQVGTFGLEASFDEVKVFDQALTPEQVAMLYGPGAPPASFGGDYLTTSEIEAVLYATQAAHPDLVEVVDFGDSYVKTQGGLDTPSGDPLAGHDLLVAKVGRGEGSKPALILTGCLHAREIATPELVLRFLDWLVEGDGVDPEATWLLDHHQIWLAPLINPDGHDLVEIGNLEHHGARPFRWRKNARPQAGCAWPPTDNGNGSGVDLNRNFPFGWGISGDRAGSNSRCDPYYRGPSAASEPETQAMMSLISALIPDQRGPGMLDAAPDDATGIFIQLHSPYRVVAWPWSDSSSPAPNAADLAAIGHQLAAYGNYDAGQVRTELYEMTGTAEGWVYGELGAAAFLMEVGEGLMPAYGRVDNVMWPEIRESLVYAAKIARTPYTLARGPLVSQAVASAGAGGITVAAKAKDAQGDPVVAAEVYLDLPPWEPGAVAYALDPQDGGFGQSQEQLRGDLPAGAAPGRHLLYLRARDAAGNWGPVTGAFVDLP